MSRDDKLAAKEILIRGLLRQPDDLDPDFGRPHQDEDDFIRKVKYKKTGLPENGISVFRRVKYLTNPEFYARIPTKKAIGASECRLDKLTAKGIQLILDGAKNDHVSLRCPDCDMKSLPTICKPKGGASFADCLLFDKADPLGLNTAFQEVEAPAVRTPSKK